MGNPREWKVGSTMIGVALGVIVLAGFYVTNNFCFSNCKSIEALQITLPSADKAVGHYRMVDAGYEGIESDRLGGACLAWRSTVPGSCKQDSDCAFPDRMTTILTAPPLTKKVLRPEFTGAYAYCSPNRTCWIKVNGNDCKKSADVLPPLALNVNEDNITKEASLPLVRAGLYGAGKGRPTIQGRVIACLNGKFTPGPGVKPPCAGGPGDVLHDWSDPPQPIRVPM